MTARRPRRRPPNARVPKASDAAQPNERETLRWQRKSRSFAALGRRPGAKTEVKTHERTLSAGQDERRHRRRRGRRSSTSARCSAPSGGRITARGPPASWRAPRPTRWSRGSSPPTARCRRSCSTRGQQAVIDDQNLMPQLTLSNSVVASEVAVLQSNLLAERVVRQLDLANSPEFNPELARPPRSTPPRAGSRTGSGLRARWTARRRPCRSGRAADPRRGHRPPAAEPSRARPGGHLLRDLDHRELEDPDWPRGSPTPRPTPTSRSRSTSAAPRTDQATEWLDKRVTDLRQQVEAAEAAISQFKSKNLVLEGSTQEAASQQLLHLATQVSEARARSAAAARALEQADALSKGGRSRRRREHRQLPVIGRCARSAPSCSEQKSASSSELYGRTTARADPRPGPSSADLDAQILTETRSYIQGLRGTAEIAAVELKIFESNLLGMESNLLNLSKSSIELQAVGARGGRGARRLRGAAGAAPRRPGRSRRSTSPTRGSCRRRIFPLVPFRPPARHARHARNHAGRGRGGGDRSWGGIVQAAATARPAELEAATGTPAYRRAAEAAAASPSRSWRGLLADPAVGLRRAAARPARGARPPRRADGTHKVIMLTSARTGEGKSTTAPLALAQIASLAGKKVIVVDGDLRHPDAERPLVLRPPRDDLASILLDGAGSSGASVGAAPKGAGFDSCRPPSPETRRRPTRSRRPPSPRLINDTTRAEYDLVLIDTAAGPRDLRRADRSQPQADMTLLVVHPGGKTSAEAIHQALANLGHWPRGEFYAAPRRRRSRASCSRCGARRACAGWVANTTRRRAGRPSLPALWRARWRRRPSFFARHSARGRCRRVKL